MKLRLNAFSLVFPSCNVHELCIVTLGLTFLSLAFHTEMSTAGLLTIKSVTCHKFTYFKEIFKSECFLKFLIEFKLTARNIDILIEIFSKFPDFLYSLLQALLITCHTYIIPHDDTKFLVD